MVTEQSDSRGLQHHLTQPIMKEMFAGFLQQLQEECSAEPGLWELARAQHRSFAGGGAAFMESYIPPAAMRSWHARMFLRSALRLLPQEVAPGSVWTCPREYCRLQRTGLGAIAHASCERSTRRHDSLVDGLLDVLRAFPGHPQLRTEVQDIPTEHCRMDVVVDGAWTGTPGAPGAAPDRRRLLVDASMPEPMSVQALGVYHAWREDGAAAAAAVREKEKRATQRSSPITTAAGWCRSSWRPGAASAARRGSCCRRQRCLRRGESAGATPAARTTPRSSATPRWLRPSSRGGCSA